jgi:hypothetical protein
MTANDNLLQAADLEEIDKRLRDANSPKPLSRIIRSALVLNGTEQNVTASEFLRWLEKAGPNNPHRATIATALACWDSIKEAEWIDETLPNTPDRRSLIIRLLDLSASDRELVNRTFPQSPSIDLPINVTRPDGWTRWYLPTRRTPSFYWSAYRQYLVEQKRWEPKSVAALDVASTDVVERLSDPLAPNITPTKGLVIGYVQSGKTANFTGVIAKAVDAGYRLVIVLAGLQNTLRAQTQRRIDKELLGQEFVESDYGSDRDWNDFLSHGGLPSEKGAFDWIRLTTKARDFRDVAKGLLHYGLMFERADKSQPFRSATNLARSAARLAVVKKNEKALRDFIQSLTSAAKYVPLHEIPALIIDDESDQASINAQGRRASDAKRRKTINGLIVRLLAELKCAQYVGYTATPFANVFIDPEDAVDLFPADFIVSLPKPMGYMGVREFTDDEREASDVESNRWAHVREIRGSDEVAGNLDVAIDAYVLSGALKVYRERILGRRFKHHTMLVHSSHLNADHAADAVRVTRFFLSSNYLGAKGTARLQRLWESDFAERCQRRAASDLVPASWRDVECCIPEAYGRITDNADPVIVLNGEDIEAAPDFDSESIWKIIVGGAKLSRGYTVEGLTISYYRRTTGATDTLLQMGRWFGFRDHYRDLVRLYIGVDEKVGNKGGKINLYEAFEAACRDEEEFRSQLSRYASLDPEERITPKNVPPLVHAHLLPPTSPNKMFNAVQTFVNFGGQTIERTSPATDSPGREFNVKLLARLFADAEPDRKGIKLSTNDEEESFDAVMAVQTNKSVGIFLKDFKWEAGAAPRDWPLVTEFVSGKHGDPQIESWLIVAPQRKSSPHGVLRLGEHDLRIKRRGRTGNRFLVFTEPAHVQFAKWAAGLIPGSAGNATTSSLFAPKRAVMLVYPVISATELGSSAGPSIGFALYFPKNQIRRQVIFSPRDQSRPNDIVVPKES